MGTAVVAVTNAVTAVNVTDETATVAPATVSGLAGLGLVSGVFNVKTDYGAKGDGTTDDTAAIQAAIAAASVAGGRVLIPGPGQYLLNTAGNSLLLNASNVEIWLDAGATLFKANTGAALWIGSDGGSYQNIRVVGAGIITPTVIPTPFPSAGIKVGSIGATVDGLTVGISLLSMGQYGIVSGATDTTISHFTLLDGCRITVDPTGWITGAGLAQAMDFNVPSGGSSGGTIGRVDFAIVDSIGLTDSFKWTNFTGRIVGASFTGGTVDQLHLGQASDFLVSGVTLTKTASSGTGLTLTGVCSNGVIDGVEADTVTSTVSMLYFGSAGTISNIQVSNFRTNGQLGASTTAAVSTCRFRNIGATKLAMTGATILTSCLFDGVTLAGGLFVIQGTGNTVRNLDVDMAGSASEPCHINGNSNVLQGLRVANSSSRGVYLDGNANYLDLCTSDNCAAGAFRVNSGTGNILGRIVQLNGTPAGQDVATATVYTPTVAARYTGHGTAHVAGDYALSAGWGTTATVSAVSAKDTGGRVTIASAGTGQGANPTVTLTWKDGTWTTAPAVVVARGEHVAPATATWESTTPGATTVVFTFLGTPVAGSSYILDFVAMGK